MPHSKVDGRLSLCRLDLSVGGFAQAVIGHNFLVIAVDVHQLKSLQIFVCGALRIELKGLRKPIVDLHRVGGGGGLHLHPDFPGQIVQGIFFGDSVSLYPVDFFGC